MAHPHENEILEALWPADLPGGMKVWVILDGARDERIYGAVDGCSLEKCCLYSGDLPWQLQMTAPYLVSLERDDRFTREVIEKGWGNSWGVFLQTEAGIKTLRRHLRSFLRVRDERGRRLIFRYSDPRVLRVYLRTCRTEELRAFFGPVASFLMEDDSAEAMLEFQFDGVQLGERRLGFGQTRAPHARMTHATPDRPAGTLVIRDAQLNMFSASRAEQFVERVSAMLERHWPQASREAGLREFVEAGIQKAKSYEIINELDMARFLNLQMALGRDFEADPRYPWAPIILEEDAFTGTRKVERLCDFAREALAAERQG